MKTNLLFCLLLLTICNGAVAQPKSIMLKAGEYSGSYKLAALSKPSKASFVVKTDHKDKCSLGKLSDGYKPCNITMEVKLNTQDKLEYEFEDLDLDGEYLTFESISKSNDTDRKQCKLKLNNKFKATGDCTPDTESNSKLTASITMNLPSDLDKEDDIESSPIIEQGDGSTTNSKENKDKEKKESRSKNK